MFAGKCLKYYFNFTLNFIYIFLLFSGGSLFFPMTAISNAPMN